MRVETKNREQIAFGYLPRSLARQGIKEGGNNLYIDATKIQVGSGHNNENRSVFRPPSLMKHSRGWTKAARETIVSLPFCPDRRIPLRLKTEDEYEDGRRGENRSVTEIEKKKGEKKQHRGNRGFRGQLLRFPRFFEGSSIVSRRKRAVLGIHGPKHGGYTARKTNERSFPAARAERQTRIQPNPPFSRVLRSLSFPRPLSFLVIHLPISFFPSSIARARARARPRTLALISLLLFNPSFFTRDSTLPLALVGLRASPPFSFLSFLSFFPLFFPSSFFS